MHPGRKWAAATIADRMAHDEIEANIAEHFRNYLVIADKEESYRIIGACFEVYKEKGNGFLEAVYQECLALEFDA